MLTVVGFISCVRTSLKLTQNTETTWNSFSVRTSWNWNKTKLSTVGWNKARPSAVLFYFSFISPCVTGLTQINSVLLCLIQSLVNSYITVKGY